MVVVLGLETSNFAQIPPLCAQNKRFEVESERGGSKRFERRSSPVSSYGPRRPPPSCPTTTPVAREGGREEHIEKGRARYHRASDRARQSVIVVTDLCLCFWCGFLFNVRERPCLHFPQFHYEREKERGGELLEVTSDTRKIPSNCSRRKR